MSPAVKPKPRKKRKTLVVPKAVQREVQAEMDRRMDRWIAAIEAVAKFDLEDGLNRVARIEDGLKAAKAKGLTTGAASALEELSLPDLETLAAQL